MFDDDGGGDSRPSRTRRGNNNNNQQQQQQQGSSKTAGGPSQAGPVRPARAPGGPPVGPDGQKRCLSLCYGQTVIVVVAITVHRRPHPGHLSISRAQLACSLAALGAMPSSSSRELIMGPPEPPSARPKLAAQAWHAYDLTPVVHPWTHTSSPRPRNPCNVDISGGVSPDPWGHATYPRTHTT